MADLMYDQLADSYDELHGKEQQQKNQIILSRLMPKIKRVSINSADKKQKVFRILDVGCGTGIFLEQLQQNMKENMKKNFLQRIELYGIDPSSKMLLIAGKKGSFVLKRGFAEKLPFPAESFDIVVSVTAAHNFNNLKKAFSEIRRVAKKDAMIIVSILKKSRRLQGCSDILASKFNVKEMIEEEHDIIFFSENSKKSLE